LSGASVCDIPIEGGKEFNVGKVKWNPNGRSILILDNKSSLMIANPQLSFLESTE